MRKILVCGVLVCLLAGCGSDRPTSFQELIFDTWTATNDRTTFRTVTIRQGSSSLSGTYVAQVVTDQDEDQMPTLAEESGTIAISGSVITFTRPGVPQPLRFTWSIDEGVLTLRGGGFGVESYRQE